MTNSDFIEQTRLLVARTQQGDHKSFAQLYDMYVNQLFNFGLRLTTDRELLKDCIHDVFVKIYVKREELSEVVNFRSYLFISLKNRICDELRRLVFGSDVQVDSLQRVAEDADVEEDYLRHEADFFQSVKVESLLRQLSKRQRQAITLYYMEEKKYEDICVIMDMNYQSVRNLVCRSLNWQWLSDLVVLFVRLSHSYNLICLLFTPPVRCCLFLPRVLSGERVIQYTIEWHSVYGFTRKSMWFHLMLKAISSTIKQ